MKKKKPFHLKALCVLDHKVIYSNPLRSEIPKQDFGFIYAEVKRALKHVVSDKWLGDSTEMLEAYRYEANDIAYQVLDLFVLIWKNF